ncbi:hypothetical protein BVY01_00535 [bacterium I07]|nr:hypothetical protein BVY01_00535 [bacterium I07]
MNSIYDIVIIGNYTKDTIESSAGIRLVDGGGFNYGAHVAAMMGLNTAAVTRLAKEDFHVVRNLEAIGVDVYPEASEFSTCLRLVYPSDNVDERTLYVMSSAGTYTPDQVKDLQAKAFLINASFRGEVGINLLQELSQKDTILSTDVQGFVRVVENGVMVYRSWEERDQVLQYIDILKTDAVEAEMLTGISDIEEAAKILASWGPREVLITHRNGVMAFAEGEFYHAEFFPVELIGRSGRGDTCISAYLCRRLSKSPHESLLWAAAVTSLKMEAEGPIKRKSTEVDELLNRLYRC